MGWGRWERAEMKFSLLSSPHSLLLAIGLLLRAARYSTYHTPNLGSVPSPKLVSLPTFPVAPNSIKILETTPAPALLYSFESLFNVRFTSLYTQVLLIHSLPPGSSSFSLLKTSSETVPLSPNIWRICRNCLPASLASGLSLPLS